MPAPPDPGPILHLLSGLRTNAALIAVLELRICGHLATGPCSAKELASRAGIAERGAQALLDVLVGLELCILEAGVYRNGPVADAYLVPQKPTYVGDEEVGQFRAMYASWAKLTDAVRTGEPAHDNDAPEMLAFWTVLTPSIARRQRPLAEEAVRLLELTTGEVSLLDVGGGAALYSLALLRQNAKARATQLDWPHINRIAAEEVKKAGVSDRFATIDGDFRTTHPGGPYDVAVLSNIVHQESLATTKELMGRLRRALRPGGRLLVSEFLVDDGRTGPPHSLLFNLTMLLNTRDGRSYERSSLARVFRESGFEDPSFHTVGPVSTLAFAKRA
jgi:SAM-dependent methyltransferase